MIGFPAKMTDSRTIAPRRRLSPAVRLVRFSETLLTLRKRRRLRLRAKASRRGPVLDWVAAFGSAMIWVLLINQYALQAYAIPSTSMEPNVLVGDHLFVDKFTFGPELLPGAGKLPGVRPPERGEIVVFESPEYASRGPVFETLNRIVFMATLSFVNLDRDENGNDRMQFLIKRAIGLPGDIVRIDPQTGELVIRPAGSADFIHAAVLLPESPPPQRLIGADRVGPIRQSAQAAAHAALLNERIRLPINTIEAASQSFDYWYLREICRASPENAAALTEYLRIELGTYVAPDRFLPIGDNRDNSRDGRYFGPVMESALLGRPLVRFWPLSRLGAP